MHTSQVVEKLKITALSCTLLTILAPPVASQTASDLATDKLDLAPEIIESSPVLQRWLQEVPDVWETIKHEPRFRTRWRWGYVVFPSADDQNGFSARIEDIFLGNTNLSVSGGYQGNFSGNRQTWGADLHYYVFPLGSYVNLSPVLGYKNITTNSYTTDGVNVGVKLLLALSATGAADLALTQSLVSPGSNDEASITTLSLGYAITPDLRISTDIGQQNSLEARENHFGIFLEWIP